MEELLHELKKKQPKNKKFQKFVDIGKQYADLAFTQLKYCTP